MKCIICHSEDINRQKVDEEVKTGKDIVLFEVEVLVCNACGERYYDTATLRRIEDLREQVKDSKAQVRKIGQVYRTKIAG